MSSFLHRYLAGEQHEVWQEIRELGPVPGPLFTDIEAVAAETMRRVGRHVRRLAEAYRDLGFIGSDEEIPMHCLPTSEELADLDTLEAEIGGLPVALRACLQEVGEVWFAGDCPKLGLTYHGGPVQLPDEVSPDPLCLPGISWLGEAWDLFRGDADGYGCSFAFEFSPDELHKANVSGATYDITLPQRVADPVLEGVAGRSGITLVEYLRISIAWGGCPGWSLAPGYTPAALEPLRVTPDF